MGAHRTQTNPLKLKAMGSGSLPGRLQRAGLTSCRALQGSGLGAEGDMLVRGWQEEDHPYRQEATHTQPETLSRAPRRTHGVPLSSGHNPTP